MKRLIASLGLAVVLYSCKHIQPIAPKVEIGQDTPPKQEVSMIQIPVEMELKKHFEEADKSVPYEFKGNEQHCEGVSYSYKFQRNPIKIEGTPGKSEQIELDIKIDGKYALNLNYCLKCSDAFTDKPTCLTPRIFTSCGVDEPMRKISVAYETKIKLQQNYKLDSKTSLKDVTPKDPCQITVFEYDATSELVKEVKKSLKDLSKEIDKGIEGLDVKKEVQTVWNGLVQPFDLQGYGFLYFNPKNVGVQNLHLKGTKLYFDAQILALPKVQLSKSNESTPKLPDLAILPQMKGFSVYLNLEANYDSLNKILNKQLKGKEIKIKRNTIVFDSAKIHGAANQQLAIVVAFSGSKKGTMYLKGTPHFNDSLQMLSFPDISFDLETKNALLKSAKWLFNDKITAVIREKAVFDIQSMLSDAKKTMNEQMNRQLDATTFLSGTLTDAKIVHFYPAMDQLFIQAQFLGDMKVVIK